MIVASIRREKVYCFKSKNKINSLNKLSLRKEWKPKSITVYTVNKPHPRQKKFNNATDKNKTSKRFVVILEHLQVNNRFWINNVYTLSNSLITA